MSWRVLTLAALLLGLIAPRADALTLSTWRRCGWDEGWKCATAVVPRDYRDPAAGTLDLAVTRHRARHSRGVIFLNYGGPGAPAIGFTHRYADLILGRAFAHFDVVAVDPRGVGRSRPAVDCHVDQRRLGPYAQPFVRSPGLVPQVLVDREQAYVRACLRRNGGVLPYLSTADNARDMDALRAALGRRRLTFVGMSYGTMLGATYAALFPQHVRALLLDGPVNPERLLNAPLEDSFAQTAGFEASLRRFLRACHGRWPRCRFRHGRPAMRAFDGLLSRLDARPLRVGRRTLNGDDARLGVTEALYARENWRDLTAALNAADRGRGRSLLRFADEAYGRRRDGTYRPFLDRFFLISGLDSAYPSTIGPFLADGTRAFAAFPHFWWNSGFNELAWGLYPVDSSAVFRGPFTLPATAAFTPLIIATTHDPATPYRNARAMIAQLGRGRVLTVRGDDHTQLTDFFLCVHRVAERYLLTTRPPRRGAACRGA